MSYHPAPCLYDPENWDQSGLGDHCTCPRPRRETRQNTDKRFVETIHVDNGGYSIGVVLSEDKGWHILIQDGYFGYSTHEIRLNSKLSPENLRKIGMQFMRAADEIEGRIS